MEYSTGMKGYRITTPGGPLWSEVVKTMIQIQINVCHFIVYRIAHGQEQLHLNSA